MYCKECGTRLPDNSQACPTCSGTPGREAGGKEFTMYEYRSLVVPKGSENLYVDCYRAFGWETVDAASSLLAIDKTALAFKRSRHIKNNIELAKLQHQCDAALQNLRTIEAKAEAVGIVPALSVGVVSLLVLGGGMALCLSANQLVLGIVVGVIGLIGCTFPYFVFRRVRGRKLDAYTVAADEQYDRISQICGQASKLL